MSAFLLAVWLRTLLLGLVGLVAIWALRKRASSSRHLIAVSTLVAMVAIPFVGQLAQPTTLAEISVDAPVVVAPMVASPASVAHSVTAVVSEESSPFSWSDAFVDLWFLGVAVGLSRVALSLVELRKHVRSSKPIDRLNAAGNRVAVMVDPLASIPMTAWWGTHRIFLPLGWEAWPEEQVSAALRHEEMHIRRGDWYTRLAGPTVAALFWPNPGVWALNRLARDLAEEAADDAVLNSGVPSWHYAQSLLLIARRAQATAPIAAIPMAQKAEVARRIEMVLKEDRTRRAVTPLGVACTALALGLVVVPMSTVAATPVPQKDQASPPQGNAVQKHPTVVGAPATYTISTKVYRVSDSFKLKPGTGGVARTASGGTVAYLSLKGRSAKEQLKELSSLDLITSPRIRTLDGQMATFRMTSGDENPFVHVLTFEPKRQKDGGILFNFGYGQSTSDHMDEMPPLTSLTANIQSGETLVILPSRDPKRKTSVAIVVTTTEDLLND